MSILDVITGPWAIQPDALVEIQSIYAAHVCGQRADLAALEARLGRPLDNAQNNRRDYQMAGDVAVISLNGVMAKRANLFDSVSGATSMQIVGQTIRAAAQDAKVKSIVLSIDSSGGTADGTQTLADTVRQAAAAKPVIAWVDGRALSAAYWVASAADAIYAGESGASLGSIGVRMRHADMSAAAEKAGIKFTDIYAGQYKVVGTDIAPLSKSDKSVMQDTVDNLYTIFVDNVARNRGVSTDQVLADMADGRTFLAAQAVSRGLADGILSLDQVIAGLSSGELPHQRRALGHPPKTSSAKAAQATAPKPPQQGDRAMDMATLRADHPDLVNALIAEGREQGLTDGASIERARILGIEAQASGLPGHEALVAKLKADGQTTPEQAAVQVLAAERGSLANRAQALHNDAPKPAPHAAAPNEESAASLDSLPLEDRCKAQWDASADLRAEFGSLAAYTAFTKNQAAGRARVLSK